MIKKIKLRLKDFKYPSAKERKEVQKNYPKLEHFKFDYKNTLVSILSEKKTIKEASNQSNLYWWNYCFRNRLSMLYDSYLFTFTNYNRGFYDDYSKCTPTQAVNKLLFDYYSETFYYYFISSRDILAQLLRCFFSGDTTKKNLYFNKKFINKIGNVDVRNLLLKFFQDTGPASDIRNEFAHRFTPNLLDYRTVVEENEKVMSFKGGKFMESDKVVENINYCLGSFSLLLQELKRLIDPK